MASSGNYPVFNPFVNTGQSLTHSNGNLEVASGSFWSSSVWSRMTLAGFGGSTGKYYAEFVNYGSSGGGSTVCGIGNYDSLAINTTKHNDAIIYYYTYIEANGSRVNLGGNYSSPDGISGNEVLRMAWDCSNGKVWLGASQEWFDVGSGVGDPANGNNPSGTISNYAGAPIGVLHNRSTNTGRCIMNFGQNGDFSGTLTAQNNTDQNGDGNFYYSVPAGFLALNTKNLIIDSDIDPAQTDSDFPGKQFNTVLYTGNASTNAISNLNFQPDLVWVKSRSNAVNSYMADSNRGTNKILSSTLNEPERTETNLTSFDSDGFTLSSNYNYRANWNESSYTYVAWCWRANGGTTASNSSGSITSTVQANTAAGFSIVTYTGNDGSWGSGNRDTFGHGLSAAPEFILIKELNATDQWTVFHAYVGDGGGSNAAANNLVLNDSSALYTNQSYKSFGETMPTSTLVTVEGNTTNSSSSNHVAYCWHSVDGYSKFGSYEGNDSTNGPFVYTGFRPRMICIKGVDEAYAWFVFDSARNPNNLVDRNVRWNDSTQEAAEPSGARRVDFFNTGFKIKATDASLNGNNDTYVYMAWADLPAKYNNGF